MEDTLVGKIKSVSLSGTEGGLSWFAIRFRDMWEIGLASVRKDKLENALDTALRDAGIQTEEEAGDPPEYVMFVSAKGATVYVGRGRGDDHDTRTPEGMFEIVKSLLDRL